MSGPEPTLWFKSVINSCFSLLLAVIALWFAVGIIKSIWPVLATIVGLILIVWLIIIGIRLYRSNRW